MNKREVRSLICAMLLGDGHIDKRDGAFIFMHSTAQEDYASWKADLLDDVFIEKKLSRRCRRRLTHPKCKGKTYSAYRVELYWKEYLGKFLRKRTYQVIQGTDKHRKNIEYLLSQIKSDLHLAIWFMDDGGEMAVNILKGGKLAAPWYGLFTNGATEGQVNLIQQWFISKYGLQSTKTTYRQTTKTGVKASYYLRFNREAAREIFKRCEPYFSQLDSMKLKFNHSFANFSSSGDGSEAKWDTLARGEDMVQKVEVPLITTQ